MGTVFALIIIVLCFYLFLIFPIILLIQCIFDPNVKLFTKIIVFFTSFIFFPYPSFWYGAVVKNGTFSKIMIGFFTTVLALIVFFVFFVGGFTGLKYMVFGSSEHWPPIIEKILNKDGPEVEEDNEVTYKGYNTYEVEDVNVFKSGKEDNKKDNTQKIEPAQD